MGLLETGGGGDELLRLDDQVCFALYAAHRAVTALYRPLLEPLGLTYPQYLVMLALWEEEDDGQGVRVSRLSERLHLETGTLTPLLKRMESHGFVERVRSREDERVVMVCLTRTGRALRADAADIPRQMLCRSGLTAKQASQLRDNLKRMLSKLGEV